MQRMALKLYQRNKQPDEWAKCRRLIILTADEKYWKKQNEETVELPKWKQSQKKRNTKSNEKTLP